MLWQEGVLMVQNKQKLLFERIYEINNPVLFRLK